MWYSYSANYDYGQLDRNARRGSGKGRDQVDGPRQSGQEQTRPAAAQRLDDELRRGGQGTEASDNRKETDGMSDNQTQGAQSRREAVPVEEVLYDSATEGQDATGAEDAAPEEAPAHKGLDEEIDDSEFDAPDVREHRFMDEMYVGDEDASPDEFVDMPSYEELMAENAKLQRQVASVVSQYDALKGEWDRYRKRSQAELERSKNLASERVATQIIPVIDDLWRSVDHMRAMGDEMIPLADGNAAIANRMVAALAKEGIEVISPLGEPFDVNRHQAIAMEQVEGQKPGVVFRVYQNGYAIGERVIRPASVGVTQ